MYIVYVDESGDPGMAPGGTPFYVVSGLIVHESDWNETFQHFLDLRRSISLVYGLPQRIHFHATEIVNGHGPYHHTQSGLSDANRLQLYLEILQFLGQLTSLRVLNIFVRKDRLTDPQTNVFELAWSRFIQRFHNFLDHGGTKGPQEFGLVFTDRTHDDELRRLLRRMRAFNYVPSQYGGSPSRRILVSRVLDDPIPRTSDHSYYIQMADLIAFALARRDYPRPGLSPYQFETFFSQLDPILLTEASKYDRQGIVYSPR